jgi:hypothetical protein
MHTLHPSSFEVTPDIFWGTSPFLSRLLAWVAIECDWLIQIKNGKVLEVTLDAIHSLLVLLSRASDGSHLERDGLRIFARAVEEVSGKKFEYMSEAQEGIREFIVTLNAIRNAKERVEGVDLEHMSDLCVAFSDHARRLLREFHHRAKSSY